MTTHPTSYYWKNCGYLMALLVLTWTLGYVNLGVFNLVAALGISFAKMILIALFFMHLKTESRMLHLTAGIGMIWFLIMLTLTLADYIGRGVVAMPKY